jgi:hypothetical protein
LSYIALEVSRRRAQFGSVQSPDAYPLLTQVPSSDELAHHSSQLCLNPENGLVAGLAIPVEILLERAVRSANQSASSERLN